MYGGININIKGISRKLDNLGRIVIPIEYRKELEIKSYDMLEMLLTDKGVLIRKPQNFCKLCGQKDNLFIFKYNFLCMDCIRELKKKSL